MNDLFGPHLAYCYLTSNSVQDSQESVCVGGSRGGGLLLWGLLRDATYFQGDFLVVSKSLELG